jgi:putative membrane protein
MALDWLLASLHHLAIFTLLAILAGELAMTGGRIDVGVVGRLVRLDAWYGVAAAAVVAAGVARVFLGAKGPEYYEANTLFWAKMATFALAGGLSVLPTLQFFAWRRAARADPHFAPSPAAVASVRRTLFVEAALFALLPIFAAGMARGFGA